MKENLDGKTWNQSIVNKFSFTLGQQGTLHYVVCTYNCVWLSLDKAWLDHQLAIMFGAFETNWWQPVSTSMIMEQQQVT